jgi:kynurenine 3-monooxygenase
MGEDQVVDDFMKGRRGGLTQVSVDPVAYPQGRGVLVGDAAHAMGQSLGRVSRARQLQCLQADSCLLSPAVPFYGQGLNCGLEDVRVLQHLLAKHGITASEGSDAELERALAEYATERKADLEAIQRLAMNN